MSRSGRRNVPADPDQMYGPTRFVGPRHPRRPPPPSEYPASRPARPPGGERSPLPAICVAACLGPTAPDEGPTERGREIRLIGGQGLRRRPSWARRQVDDRTPSAAKSTPTNAVPWMTSGAPPCPDQGDVLRLPPRASVSRNNPGKRNSVNTRPGPADAEDAARAGPRLGAMNVREKPKATAAQVPAKSPRIPSETP